jgi:predicted RNA-binding Zn ribbon-like protein
MRVTRARLDEARELREAIDACAAAIVEGRRPPRAALTLVDDWLVHAGGRPQLVRGDGGVPVLTERLASDSPRRMLGTIALDAATMLGTPAERDRIRVCASPTCSARFYDRSPAGRRVWCSMRACGNAAKARRHRERARA